MAIGLLAREGFSLGTITVPRGGVISDAGQVAAILSSTAALHCEQFEILAGAAAAPPAPAGPPAETPAQRAELVADLETALADELKTEPGA